MSIEIRDGVRLTYTTLEAAQLLGIHPKSVYRLLQRGKLTGPTALRIKLVSRESLESFAKGQA